MDTNTDVRAELVVDDEHFAVRVGGGDVSVRCEADPGAPVSISMGYEPLIDMVDGRMPRGEFVADHVKATRGSTEVAVPPEQLGRSGAAPIDVEEELLRKHRT